MVRCDPPSLLKVTWQATAVYMFSIIVFISHYYIGRAARKELEVTFEDYLWFVRANLIWTSVVIYVFPIVFFGYVWITIKCRGYMPSATGNMKELVSLT
jgi:hypothetical protein